MLKRVEIRNVNSIDFCEIEFIKGNYKFHEDNTSGDIVNPIAIYGHNGSGKTSFINAIGQLINLMSLPIENLRPFTVNNFRYEKYMSDGLNDKSDIKGSIKLIFDIKENSFEYFIETSLENAISSEYLLKNSVTYFNRTFKLCTYNNKKTDINAFSSLVPSLRMLASSEINDETIQVVYAYISSFTNIDLPLINRGSFVTSKLFVNTNSYELMANKSSEVKEILKGYKTFPIYDVVKSNAATANGILAPKFDVVIEDGDFKGTLPIGMMSCGMKNQSLLLSILVSVPENSVVFIDEVDSALHPSTIKDFLEAIKRKNIQIVFTLHNTYALQFLRPDQVYLSKWSKGFSSFYRLSKVYPNIREINNMEKMYLSSLFDEAMENNGK